MAVGDTYISAQELSASLNIQGVADLSEIDRAIKAASRAIDEYCGRVFYNANVASTRRYRPVMSNLILTDDFHTLTGVTVDTNDDRTFSTTLAASDYDLEPLNLKPGRPYLGVMTRTAMRGYPLVDITAIWGWPAVPPQVEQACVFIAKKLLARRQSPDAIAAVTDQMAVRVASTDPDAQALLAPLRRYVPAVA